MLRNLADLLMHLIQNLFAAEEHMSEAMAAIIEKVNHNSLKNALNHHLNLTAEQKKTTGTDCTNASAKKD